MAKTKVVLNLAGFRALRNDPAVVADLAARAERIADAAGSGYEHGAETGRNRAHGYVVTSSSAAMRDNAHNNTLIKSLDAGR